MSLFQLNPVEPPWYATRMPGGVGGVAPRGAPYPDQSGLPRRAVLGAFLAAHSCGCSLPDQESEKGRQCQFDGGPHRTISATLRQ
jgi:hypothetical protein